MRRLRASSHGAHATSRLHCEIRLPPSSPGQVEEETHPRTIIQVQLGLAFRFPGTASLDFWSLDSDIVECLWLPWKSHSSDSCKLCTAVGLLGGHTLLAIGFGGSSSGPALLLAHPAICLQCKRCSILGEDWPGYEFGKSLVESGV